jgi:hypothetical protein
MGESRTPRSPFPTIGGGNLNIKRGMMGQRVTGEKDILKFRHAGADLAG